MTTDGTFRVAYLTTVDMTLALLLRDNLSALRDAGADVVGISAPGPWVATLTDAGIRHVALPSSTRGMHPFADARAAAQLWRVLRAERPTILHTHTPKPALYGRILGRLAGVPIVVNTIHGLYATEDDPWPRRLVVYALEAIASRFADSDLLVNPEDLSVIQRRRLAPRGSARLVGHGLDLTRFDAARVRSAARAEVRAELGMSEDTVVIGTVGRLVAEKGLPELFRAAEVVADRTRVFVVIGPSDPDKPDALTHSDMERARNAGVKFLGTRSDVERMYAAMDIFVLASHREGLPQSAMEAAAMGLPIVASDIRGCRQVVDDGRNGVLFPVGDIAALTAALQTLSADAGLRRAMGKASAEKARREFDGEAAFERVIEVYREVAMEKSITHLLPMQLRGDSPVEIRSAAAEDAPVIAGLHAEGISEGFLPRLGRRFLTVLYRSLIAWEDAVVLVAADAAGPVAFVVGVVDVKAFYRHFLRRYWLRAGFAAVPRVLVPANLRQALESMRYAGDRLDVPAELLAMAVAPPVRRQGLATRLGSDLLDRLRGRGADRVKVVVGSENAAALAAYRRMGFAPVGETEVHAGSPSTVMAWPA